MEYDLVLGLRSTPGAPGLDEDTDVTGYVIVGGAPWARPSVATPAVFSLGVRAPYSAPQIGAIYLGINPDG